MRRVKNSNRNVHRFFFLNYGKSPSRIGKCKNNHINLHSNIINKPPTWTLPPLSNLKNTDSIKLTDMALLLSKINLFEYNSKRCVTVHEVHQKMAFQKKDESRKFDKDPIQEEHTVSISGFTTTSIIDAARNFKSFIQLDKEKMTERIIGKKITERKIHLYSTKMLLVFFRAAYEIFNSVNFFQTFHLKSQTPHQLVVPFITNCSLQNISTLLSTAFNLRFSSRFKSIPTKMVYIVAKTLTTSLRITNEPDHMASVHTGAVKVNECTTGVYVTQQKHFAN